MKIKHKDLFNEEQVYTIEEGKLGYVIINNEKYLCVITQTSAGIYKLICLEENQANRMNDNMGKRGEPITRLLDKEEKWIPVEVEIIVS